MLSLSFFELQESRLNLVRKDWPGPAWCLSRVPRLMACGILVACQRFIATLRNRMNFIIGFALWHLSTAAADCVEDMP